MIGATQAQTPKDLIAALLVKWNEPTPPFKMIGNVYYVGTDGLASYLITSPQGHMLIDTVMPEATSQIKGNIENLGFKVADIKYLLNTHAHIDHTGGLAEMKQASGGQLIAGEADMPLLEGGYYPGAREEAVLAFPPVKVDRGIDQMMKAGPDGRLPWTKVENCYARIARDEGAPDFRACAARARLARFSLRAHETIPRILTWINTAYGLSAPVSCRLGGGSNAKIGFDYFDDGYRFNSRARPGSEI